MRYGDSSPRKRRRAKAKGRKDAGDIWTWIALDPDTKLVISYLCGSRSAQAAFGFMLDLKGRLVGPTLTSLLMAL